MGAIERYSKTDQRFREEDHLYFNDYRAFMMRWARGKVLDLGCGEGWLTKDIASLPQVTSVLAVDKFADQPDMNKGPNIRYEVADLTKYKIDGEYDTILSTEFVEHIPSDSFQYLLDEIYNHLAKDGQFIGSTPNTSGGSHNPFHIHEYNIREFRDILLDHGFDSELVERPFSLMCFRAWKSPK